jgi:hypothetical protein
MEINDILREIGQFFTNADVGIAVLVAIALAIWLLRPVLLRAVDALRTSVDNEVLGEILRSFAQASKQALDGYIAARMEEAKATPAKWDDVALESLRESLNILFDRVEDLESSFVEDEDEAAAEPIN